MVSRRKFLGTLIGSGALYRSAFGRELLGENPTQEVAADSSRSKSQQRKVIRIDRAALVTRHNPTLVKLDPLSPLSLGNGEFAFE